METKLNSVNHLRIALVGDYSSQIEAHRAIPAALDLAVPAGNFKIVTEFVETESISEPGKQKLAAFDAIWCVPGSPYRNMDGALTAIGFARENEIPFLGTCGGFQHALVEYARNVLGISEADHVESNPDAKMPLISPLSCSLVGRSGEIWLKEGTRAKSAYGTEKITENFHCNYGLNPDFSSLLATGDLKVSGVDEQGAVRIVELTNHPFFVATLFQPELSALSGSKHPLILEFVHSATNFRAMRKAQSAAQNKA